MQFKKNTPTGGFGDNAVVNFDVLDAKYIINKLPSNGLVRIEPDVSSAFTAGAVSAYGLTRDNLLQSKGKTSSSNRCEGAPHSPS